MKLFFLNENKTYFFIPISNKKIALSLNSYLTLFLLSNIINTILGKMFKEVRKFYFLYFEKISTTIKWIL